MIVFTLTCLYQFIDSTPSVNYQRQENANLTNRRNRETPAQQTMKAVVMDNAQDTSKLVVTIPEDLPLGDDERALLAKGPNFIPITTLTDEKRGQREIFQTTTPEGLFH